MPPQDGIALLIVLAMIVLVAALSLAILLVSRSELRSSRKYADGLSARQLSETGVNLALSQIQLGTGQDETLPGRETWASQPGAIRRYNESGVSGGFAAG